MIFFFKEAVTRSKLRFSSIADTLLSGFGSSAVERAISAMSNTRFNARLALAANQIFLFLGLLPVFISLVAELEYVIERSETFLAVRTVDRVGIEQVKETAGVRDLHHLK